MTRTQTRRSSHSLKVKRYNNIREILFSFAAAIPTLMALDSKAAFQQRAAQIEIPVQEIDALELAGIDTFAKYAFCSQYQPGAQDERPLVDFLQATLGAAPNAEMLPKYRRLFFRESCTLSPRLEAEGGAHRAH